MTAPLPNSTIYYTTDGADPRVMFTGAVSNSAVAYSGPITNNQTARIRARSLWQGTNWSAMSEADFNVASLEQEPRHAARDGRKRDRELDHRDRRRREPARLQPMREVTPITVPRAPALAQPQGREPR